MCGFSNGGRIITSSVGQAKELTASMVLALSESLSNIDDLRKLAIDGLGMKPHVLWKHISDSRDRYTEAAYNLLEAWLQQQDNRHIAYTRLCQAIRNIGLNFLIEEGGL